MLNYRYPYNIIVLALFYHFIIELYSYVFDIKTVLLPFSVGIIISYIEYSNLTSKAFICIFVIFMHAIVFFTKAIFLHYNKSYFDIYFFMQSLLTFVSIQILISIIALCVTNKIKSFYRNRVN